jgi:Fungal specific transcription factor domain
MHALLALGASHLTRVSPQSDYNTAAIVHRGKAIKGLNEALANTNRGYGESDTMLAACYALTFQASYMGDGMTDFITMVRGCALVTQQIKQDQSQTAFNLEQDIHVRLMATRMDQMPQLDPALLTPAIISTEELRPVLRTTMDHHFHSSLLSTLFALQDSSKAGYLSFIHLYTTFFDMTHDQFNVFLDINNMPSQLLMAHFISLQMLMVPLVVHEWPQRSDASKAGVLLGNVEWGDRIFERMPAEMTGYLQWPKEILDMVRKEIEALLAGTYRTMRLRILNP